MRAPDLIVGYADGYRTAWDAASDNVTRRIRDNAQGLERRPLRGPAAGSRRAFLQSQDRRGRSRNRGYGAHAFCVVRRRAARVDGRKAGIRVVAIARRCCLLCGRVRLRGTRAQYPSVIVSGRRWHGPGISGSALGGSAEPRPVAPRGRISAARDHHAAAESGGLVDIHYRRRPRTGMASTISCIAIRERCCRFLRWAKPMRRAALLSAGGEFRWDLHEFIRSAVARRFGSL